MKRGKVLEIAKESLRVIGAPKRVADGILESIGEPWRPPAVGEEDLARYVDYTLLKPDATEDDIKKLVETAIERGYFGVCVNPCYVPLVASLLGEKGRVCSVCGFPLGASPTHAKVAEALWAIAHGADEIDMVANIGWLKSGRLADVAFDIRAVAEVCKERKITLKVIIEACLLTDEEKVAVCILAKASGADFVKTSTGFSKGGATVPDVELMRFVVGPEMGVKAAGGIRTPERAIEMIRAGATRIGTSTDIAGRLREREGV